MLKIIEKHRTKKKILNLVDEAKIEMGEEQHYTYAIELLDEAEALTKLSDTELCTKIQYDIKVLRQKARVLLIGYYIHLNVFPLIQRRTFWHALEELNIQTERIEELGFVDLDSVPWIGIDKLVTEFRRVDKMYIGENIPKNITELRKFICTEGLHDERIAIRRYRMPQNFSSLLVSLKRIEYFANAGELDITDIDMDKLYKEARVAGVEHQKVELYRALENIGKIIKDAGVEDTIGDLALVDTELLEEKIYDIKQRIMNVKKT